MATIIEEFADLKNKIRFSHGQPNIEPRDGIKISDTGPIVRSIERVPGEGDLVHGAGAGWPRTSGRPIIFGRRAAKNIQPLPHYR